MRYFDNKKSTEEKQTMTEEKKSWWDKFTSINICVLPFGNDGRGTPVRLFPFVGMVIFIAAIVIYDLKFAG